MGSIPLLALDARPPAAPPNMLEQYGQLMALKNQQAQQVQAQAMYPLQQQQAQQQVQEGQQRIQSNDLDVAAKQRMAKDAQTISALSPQFVTKDASGRPTGYDYDALANAAQSAGVAPQSLSPLMSIRETAAKTALTQAQGKKANLESMEALNTEAYNHIAGLQGMTDPAQRQQAWQSALQWTQQHAQDLNIDPSKLPQQAPTDDQLPIFEATLGCTRNSKKMLARCWTTRARKQT